MTREVELVSYLPPFLTEYKELVSTLTIENPEFNLVWNAADKVLCNEFIETADEYGISRFEKLLQIVPSAEDTIEGRRARVHLRWLNTVPYTMRIFISKLLSLSGNNSFCITKQFEHYKLYLKTNLDSYGQVDELKYILEAILPCNMIVISENAVLCHAEGNAITGGGCCFVNIFSIMEDFNEVYDLQTSAIMGGGIVNVDFTTITADFNETFNISGKAVVAVGNVQTCYILEQ